MKSPLSSDQVSSAPGGPAVEGALAAPWRADDAAQATPRPVTRGESSPTFVPSSSHHPFAAFTDYLTVTFPFPLGEAGIQPFFVGLCAAIGTKLGMLRERRGGLHGYRHSYAFERHGALFAFGGQRGTAMLSLPGEACAIVPDWLGLVMFLRDALQARITRWDGAVDDLLGMRSVDDAVTWYLTGGFNTGGNQPSCRQQGNWITPDKKGRTFYVGSRVNGKLIRIYEKGKQLGDGESPWVRFEVELHNRDREIPFEVLLKPGHYVAGSSPCLRWVCDEAYRVPTLRKQKATTYAHAVHWASVGVGQLVNTMVEIEGSPEAVVEKLRRPGHPPRLLLPDVPPGEGLRP